MEELKNKIKKEILEEIAPCISAIQDILIEKRIVTNKELSTKNEAKRELYKKYENILKAMTPEEVKEVLKEFESEA